MHRIAPHQSMQGVCVAAATIRLARPEQDEVIPSPGGALPFSRSPSAPSGAKAVSFDTPRVQRHPFRCRRRCATRQPTPGLLLLSMVGDAVKPTSPAVIEVVANSAKHANIEPPHEGYQLIEGYVFESVVEPDLEGSTHGRRPPHGGEPKRRRQPGLPSPRPSTADARWRHEER